MQRQKRYGVLGALAAAMLAAVPLTGPAAPAVAEVVETGVVTRVVDGDTLLVDIDDDGTTRPHRIRVTGINTAELTTYGADMSLLQGECHGVEATRRMHEMVFGKRVRLVSRYTASASVGSPGRIRPRRVVFAQVDDEWRDVGQVLVTDGLALWLPNKDEYDANRDYSLRAARAAALGIGMWDTDACGVGPDQDAQLSVTAHWNPPGNDRSNINGEYIEVHNAGLAPVDVSGWWVRDSTTRRFVIPAGKVVKPGRSLYVHAGRGKARGKHLYWAQQKPIFENASDAPGYLGDGAYLFDPEGDLRAWHQYPCRWACPVVPEAPVTP